MYHRLVSSELASIATGAFEFLRKNAIHDTVGDVKEEEIVEE